MSFLSSIGHFVGNLFGGDDDDERKKKQRQQQSRPQISFQRPASNQQPQPAGFDERPEKALNTINLLDAGNNTEQQPSELDKLTQTNLEKARQDTSRGQNWLERNVLNRGANERNAEVVARTRASRQYQEEHGYNHNPAVLRFSHQTLEKANQNSTDSARSGERLNRLDRGLKKTFDIAGNIPVVGSILKGEATIAEKLARATGVDDAADRLSESRRHLSLGMGNEEFNQLPEEQRHKLQLLETADTALSPLDFLGVAGLAKAPIVAGAKKAAKELATEGVVSDATRELVKAGVREQGKQAGVGFGVGTGVSAAGQQYLSGDVDAADTLHGGLIGSGIALLTPGGTLRKAAQTNAHGEVTKLPIVSEGDRVVPQPDEVSAGIKSVNPEASEASRAAAEAAQEAGEAVPTPTQPVEAPEAPEAPEARPQTPEVGPAADTTPAFQRKADQEAALKVNQAAGDEEAIRLGVGPNEQDTTPTFQFKQQIQEVMNQAEQELNDYVSNHQGISREELEAAQADIQRQALERINAMQARREGAAVEVTTPPEPTPALVSPNPLAAAPAQEAPLPSPETPVAPVAEPGEAPNFVIAKGQGKTGGLPDVPAATLESLNTPSGGETVDVAPRSHDALVKSLGEPFKDLKGEYSQKDALNIDELKQRAEAQIANMTDEQVLQSFQTTGPDTMIRDSNSMALARAALDRLAKMPDNPAAVQQVTNILDALDHYKSKSGEALRIAQEEFDNMPLPMKVRYVVKKIDALNRDTEGYVPLADDPARAARVEDEITYHLRNSQNIAETVSALEGRLQNVADMARNGEASPENINAIVKQLSTEKRKLAANNGELVKFFQTLVPGRTKGQKALNDFPRTMMLASFTGRVNDVLTTSANVARLLGTNFTQGLLAKAVNFIKGPGTVTDTFAGGDRILSGGAEALKKTAGEVQGTQYAYDLEKALRNNIEMRSGMQKATNPITRTVQAATEAATKASEGVQDQRLYQLALQEADQLGVEGPLREQYATARAATPSRTMMENASVLHQEVNNLNANPVTHALNRVAASIEGNSGLGGMLKNQVIPFTSWLGGNIWNSVTDRNVVASAIKLAGAVGKGDPERIVNQTAKTINGAAEGYALGYVLTQMGLITNENAEGYNDDGAYVHLGDRYIPVGFFGAFAPNIVLGNAAYHGLNDNPEGSPASKVGTFASQSIGNLLQSVAFTSALGQENNLTRAFDAASHRGGVTTPEGQTAGGATLAAGAGGQFLPGFFGDMNAVLNNGLPGITGLAKLNPTHEAADTKVIDPNSASGEAKDIPRTALNQLLNRIPVVSQLAFPRKAGVAANDLTDRSTRGSRETTTQVAAREKEQSIADRSADFKQRGIPDPEEKNFDDAVTNAADAGQFSAAIEGLQTKLDDMKSNKEGTANDREKLEHKIKEYKVLDSSGFTTADYDTYKSIGVSDWRKLGDPDSEFYDLDAYNKLWAIDAALAKEGVGLGSGIRKGKQKYSVATKGSGKGRGGASRVKSNTIGSIPELANISLSKLVGRQTGAPAIPTVEKRRPQDLVKKRKITVSKVG